MTICDEFEKALKAEFSIDNAQSADYVIACWAAKWMAERICKEAQNLSYQGAKQMLTNLDGSIKTSEVKQLIKEL